MYDKLLDLLAIGPEVLEKGDRLGQATPNQFFPALVEVVEEVRVLDSRLQTYYAELSSFYPGLLYWEAPSAVTILDDSDKNAGVVDSNALTPFRFRDIEMARILTLYWAMRALVWAGLTDLHATVETMSSQNVLGTEAKQVLHYLALEPKSWLEPVRKVCQSVEFCNSEGPPGIGPLILAACSYFTEIPPLLTLV